MMEELLALLYACSVAALIGFGAGALFRLICGVIESILLRRK